MTRKFTSLTPLLIATILGLSAYCWSGNLPLLSGSSLISSAEARIGRPLTPMSFAGVARRTTRRAVVYGAAAGAVAGAAVYAAPSCVRVQVTDAYGRIVTVCQ